MELKIRKYESLQSMQGAGDLIAKVIEKTILNHLPDNIAKTLQDCTGCNKRKNALNVLIPFSK